MRSITLLSAMVCMASGAWSQEGPVYPTKPVRFIVGFAPGGGTDVVARGVANKLSEMWKQQVAVDNRPGAATIVGTELAARAPADGYTMLLASSSYAINAAFQKKLPYDPLKDLIAVTQTAFQPYVIVVYPGVPARSLKELIGYARANPGKLNYGSPGSGSGGHLAAELFRMVTQTEMVHVPYRGGALALTDLLGGQIQMMFPTILTVAPHIKSGGMRSLAVTSSRRSSALPDVPTVAEAALPGFVAASWNGVMVPAGTPPAIVAKLNRDIVQVLKTSEVRDMLAADGAEPMGNTQEQFARHIREEIQKWTKVISAAGIKSD